MAEPRPRGPKRLKYRESAGTLALGPSAVARVREARMRVNWASEASPPSGIYNWHDFYCIVVRVARYRIASKCFYALLFRRPRGEKYRNTIYATLRGVPARPQC